MTASRKTPGGRGPGGKKGNRTAGAAFASVLLVSLLLLASCVSIGRGDISGRGASSAANVRQKTAAEVAAVKKELVEAANIFRKSQTLAVGSRKFNMDCSGVVSAIYWYAGIDIQKYFSSYSGTGTERIYSTLNDRKLIKKTWLPEPGDIVFWDNTFDRNSNGRDDDELTHIGMVVSRDKQGNIVYVHHHYERGIVFEYMNLRYKNYHSRSVRGKNITINSPMRVRGGSRQEKNWLSGQLFNSFGEGYLLD